MTCYNQQSSRCARILHETADFFTPTPRPILRFIMPHVRLADLRYSVESIIVEAWLNDAVEQRRILVVGGDPLLHLPLAKEGASLVGMTTDARKVKEAHALAQKMGIADRVQFYVSDLLRIPFPAAHFDAVLCGPVLAQSTDDLFVLREMTRVLKSGGILGLTLPAFEAAGTLVKYLPRHWLIDELVQPEGVSATGAPLPSPRTTLGELVKLYLQEQNQLRRLYNFTKLGTRLDLLGLEIADHGPYLTRVGALVYEAFHTLRLLDRRRGMGRWLYALLSPLLLGPVLLFDATSQSAQGYGLRIAAVKRSDHGSAPRWNDEGGGLAIEWDTVVEQARERERITPVIPF